MHPVNTLLSVMRLRLCRSNESAKATTEFVAQYNRQLNELKANSRGFKVFRDFHYDAGDHPQDYTHFECEFAARHLATRNPKTVLDIGSYRVFVLGLLAGYKVTTLDIRKRESSLDNETVLTSDAKQFDVQSGSFDAVVSLCALEHFGLGRYGDAFDLDADKKAFNEMIRVLKPGGALVFTTAITGAAPSICFNAHRIYDYKMIGALCDGLELGKEEFYSHKLRSVCSIEQISNVPTVWDVYCGCWIKR